MKSIRKTINYCIRIHFHNLNLDHALNPGLPLIHDLDGQAMEAGRLVSISSVDLK